MVIHAVMGVCMIPCGEYWNEKRVGLWLEIWEILTFKKQTGGRRPYERKQGVVRGERGKQECVVKRHFKREEVGWSVRF